MKKSKKVLSLLLSVLVVIACLSPIAALADAINSPSTAKQLVLNQDASTTFRFYSPINYYEDSIDEDAVYYKFTPSYTGYYEFSATGYENGVYRDGYTPMVYLWINDMYGNYIGSEYTNEYTLETKFAVILQQGMTYYIELGNNAIRNLRDVYYPYNNGEPVSAQQSIVLKVAPHEHNYKVTKYTYTTDYDCYYCDYWYSVDNDNGQTNYTSSPTIVYNTVGWISLSNYAYTYNGKVQTPSVTAYDSNGNVIPSSAYSVSISGDKKSVGTYAVNVYFNSTYGNNSATQYYTIYPKTTKVKSASAKKKAINVKWNKQAKQTNGYQVQVATDKNFTKNVKTLTVSKNSKTSGDVKGLKAKKKYYIRIRTYKKVGSSKIYSDWKKFSKTVKTK